MNIVKRLTAFAIFLFSLVPTVNLHADEWEVDVAPYLWAAGMSGEAANLPGA